MSFDRVEIPYGAYWSTPFAKWQGALQHLHSMKLAAHVAKAELAKRNIDPKSFDTGVLGLTNNQYQSFYGAPWPLHEIGATHTPGHMITQVCATGARVVFAGASEIQLGMAQQALILAADRCSNGPHIYYPAPKGPGGYGQSEDQVLYNMMNDAIGGHSMLTTAENVAKKFGVTREEADAVTLRRFEQYQDALANGNAFQKRYMTLPFSVPKPNFKAEDTVMTGDEGVFPTTAEGLAKLKPVLEGGVVTFGSQTHPADGNVGMVLTTPERAAELSSDPSIRVRLRGFAQGRADLGYMPEAPILASQKALDAAGVKISDIAAIKSHNPFAVNDVAFAKATGVDVMSLNNYGSSLIWGHPQGPTGLRAIVELIEELAIRGGGLGLFQGCAAGDSSMAAVIEVSSR
ncbi:thiolase family protein [Phenylobacterium sp.]|jgi:acetyl-CoA acetyltransferase family protein|uniref:thiolase family protein n=1 Tax=Phenylobacterium sp. TaxID=1871053 RepID=UPI003783FB11